jgi:ABC-type nitrate/sulfonate/bicarbonate transport system permease component
MPIAALVPMALILFGAGPQMEIALIAFGCCWPILVSTTDGVRGADPMMAEVARVYGLTPRQRVLRITLPSALPQIFAGLRIALAIGVATMVIANMFGSANGLGYFIIDAQQSFSVTRMWAGILMIGLVGATASMVLAAVQYWLLAWHRGWRASVAETS